jgi:hypothetical protein
VSAWIVSKTHVDLLVTAGLRRPEYGPLRYWYEREDGSGGGFDLTAERATEVGRMLWQACFDSVDARYPGEAPEELPGPPDFDASSIEGYRFEEVPGPIDPVVVLVSISCFAYQASEHEGWPRSEAKGYLDALKDHMVANLPGYEEAPWGFDERDYFTKRQGDATPG